MAVFSPWALGSVPRWAVAVMNAAGCLVGLVWLLGRLAEARHPGSIPRRNPTRPRWITRGFGGLTILVLVWTLVSALNAKSFFVPGEDRLEDYPHYLSWLPHSYDGPATWFAFWTYLGLAGVFWGGGDWLIALSDDERDCRERKCDGALFSRNARVLLWVLAINGGLLALVSMAQRLDGTPKLLWLFDGPGPMAQFGPFDYRGNAAQYFNLLWPSVLGFWWELGRSEQAVGYSPGRVGGSPRMFLPLAVVAMAACPFVATTRGGAMVAGGLLGVGFGVFILAPGRKGRLRRGVALGACALGVTVGLWLGWAKLGPRLLPPDLAEPLALSEPIEAFDLQMRVRVPDGRVPNKIHLVSLSRYSRWSVTEPGQFLVRIFTNGALVVQQYGVEPPDNRLR
ncbi:MAG: hypothetical protein H7A46_24445, partial [Verrucomicrobiales bacterium]|nr:hypothetical protein [Verrucomicrobiales bacterium]